MDMSPKVLPKHVDCTPRRLRPDDGIVNARLVRVSQKVAYRKTLAAEQVNSVPVSFTVSPLDVSINITRVI